MIATGPPQMPLSRSHALLEPSETQLSLGWPLKIRIVQLGRQDLSPLASGWQVYPGRPQPWPTLGHEARQR